MVKDHSSLERFKYLRLLDNRCLEEEWIMTKKLILLALILMALVDPGQSQVKEVSAFADVYVDVNSGHVVNSNTLRCATVTESLAYDESNGSSLTVDGKNNRTSEGLSTIPLIEGESGFMGASMAEGNASYPSVAMVQFDLSGINFTDDGVGILVMRAQRVEKADENQSAIVGIIPVASYWGENTGFLGIMSNWMQLLQVIEEGGVNDIMRRMAINTASDRTFAFDVSKNIKEARDGKVSFVVMVLSDGSYTVDFGSRESAEGPYLIIMPYPRGGKPATILAANPAAGPAIPKVSVTGGEVSSSASSPKITSAMAFVDHKDEVKAKAAGCNATSSKGTAGTTPPMIRKHR
jgi:hypothetical protein